MNVLLTGVTGLLGRHLARRMAASAKNTIIGIARDVREAVPSVHYVYGQIQNRRTYQGVPGEIDVCIHTAAAVPSKEQIGGQEECIVTNIQGTLELVKFLRSTSPHAYILVTSTIYVYRPLDNETKTEDSVVMPDTFYALSKLYSESIVLKSGLRAGVLRLSSLYDSRGEARVHQKLLYDWVDRARDGQDLVIWGTGGERRNYLHVDDAVEAVVQAVSREAVGIYNIASDHTASTYEIAQTILKLTGSSSEIVVDSTKSIYAPISGVSIEKARRELNFQPRIGLASGLQLILSCANE